MKKFLICISVVLVITLVFSAVEYSTESKKDSIEVPDSLESDTIATADTLICID